MQIAITLATHNVRNVMHFFLFINNFYYKIFLFEEFYLKTLTTEITVFNGSRIIKMEISVPLELK